eukprot:2129689-Amphidinium_carterae.1
MASYLDHMNGKDRKRSVAIAPLAPRLAGRPLAESAAMHLHLWAFALQLQWLTVAATTGGSSLCPCLDELPGGMPRVSDNDSRLIYEELGGRQYYLPEDYGIGCMAHDWELEPHCSAPDDAPT